MIRRSFTFWSIALFLLSCQVTLHSVQQTRQRRRAYTGRHLALKPVARRSGRHTKFKPKPVVLGPFAKGLEKRLETGNRLRVAVDDTSPQPVVSMA